MCDRDVVERAGAMMGCKAVYIQRNSQRNPKWQDAFVARVTGKRAVELMQELRPLMGERRRSQIDAALAERRVRHPMRVLSDEQAQEVRRAKGSQSATNLASRLGVSRSLIYNIWQGQRYKELR